MDGLSDLPLFEQFEEIQKGKEPVQASGQVSHRVGQIHWVAHLALPKKWWMDKFGLFSRGGSRHACLHGE